MEKVDYDARLQAVCAAGRQMSPDALQTWMERSLATCRRRGHWSGSTWARVPAA